MIIDKLYQRAKEKGAVCVGLDTNVSYIKENTANYHMNLEDKIFNFNKSIIDATSDIACCFKVQIAYYEAMGIDGLLAYKRTLQYIKQNKHISIGDIKRGDISSTASMYAKAHFEGDFESDFVTLNPYMGYDVLSAYEKYLQKGDKGVFMLIKTSNESANDFQTLNVNERLLYMEVANKVSEWGQKYIGSSGYSLIGGVVGCNNKKEILDIRDKNKNMFYLIPGYGAQGGTGKDLADLFNDDICGVVNSSRKIINSDDPKKSALEMKEDILKWLK